jgi:ABC-type phosphate transport system permease subunit
VEDYITVFKGRKQSFKTAAIPNLAMRRAFANAIAITFLAGNTWRLPRAQARSPNSAMPPARTYLEYSSTGTGCQV